MFELDVRTLNFVAAAIYLAAALVIGLQRPPPVRATALSVRLWSAGFGAVALGALLIALRGDINAIFSVVLANMLLIGGYGVFPLGVLAIQGRAVPRWPVPAAALLAAAGIVWWWYVEPDVRFRTVAIATLASVLSVWLFVVLRPWETDDTVRSRRLTAVVSLAWGLLLAQHAIDTATDDPLPGPALAGGLRALNAGGTIVAGVAYALCFLMMLAERSNAALREDIERRNRLITVLAHDLRSPFSGLLAGTETMALFARRGETERALALAGQINHAATRTWQLVDGLLVWVRHQLAGGRHEPVALLAACARAFDHLEPAAEEKGVAFALPEGPDLAVWGDSGGVETVLRNLLANALKFSHPGGAVTVTLAADGDRATVTVADRGTGMTPEVLARVRDPDARYTAAGTAGESGSGLGLAFCRDLVIGYGGTLEIESAAGEGTTVRVTLPRA